jgi:YlqD protein
LKILHTIIVKQVLTVSTKEALQKRYEDQKFQLRREHEQLQFEWKKIERSKKYPSQKLSRHFQKEMEDKLEKIKLLNFQLEQLDILPIGSELKEKEIQGMIDIQVGDNWDEAALAKTIIIEDGVIKEIR